MVKEHAIVCVKVCVNSEVGKREKKRKKEFFLTRCAGTVTVKCCLTGCVSCVSTCVRNSKFFLRKCAGSVTAPSRILCVILCVFCVSNRVVESGKE